MLWSQYKEFQNKELYVLGVPTSWSSILFLGSRLMNHQRGI